MTIIARDGFSFYVSISQDSEMEMPWDNSDGRGVVVEYAAHMADNPSRYVTLPTDVGATNYAFDMVATREKAVAECWGIAASDGMSSDAIIDAAVHAEYTRLADFTMGRWWYVMVTVTLLDVAGHQLTDYQQMVGGIESDDTDWQMEHAYAMADEILTQNNCFPGGKVVIRLR